MSDRIKGWDGPFEPALPSLDDNHYYHGFNKRQRAAIDLRVPDSGTPWLDEMIRQSVRNDMAKHFISGLVSNPDFRTAIEDPNKIPDELSRLGLELADALLARIGGAK